MSGPTAEELLEHHRLYDQYVDVVSAFEWLWTETKDMPDTVAHFERFPSVHARDDRPATPDFSVAFVDGTGLVGEIARIALHESSVDDLCRQIGRYDDLTHLPGPDGELIGVSHVDVLLLVPLDIGTDAVRRIIVERLANEHHDYKPTHPPCIVQYAAQPDKYVFQRRPDEGNGRLRDGNRNPGLGHWLALSDLKPPAAGFAAVKARQPAVGYASPKRCASQEPFSFGDGGGVEVGTLTFAAPSVGSATTAPGRWPPCWVRAGCQDVVVVGDAAVAA